MKIIFALGILLLAGCEPRSGISEDFMDEHTISLALPPGAQNVKYMGNGWATFDFEGRHFLFRRTRWDGSASDCITFIPQ